MNNNPSEDLVEEIKYLRDINNILKKERNECNLKLGTTDDNEMINYIYRELDDYDIMLFNNSQRLNLFE